MSDIDSPSLEITATLDDAILMRHQSGQEFIVGNVSHDLLGRWGNGRRIHTTFITQVIDEATFRTRSGCVFRVITWKN